MKPSPTTKICVLVLCIAMFGVSNLFGEEPPVRASDRKRIDELRTEWMRLMDRQQYSAALDVGLRLLEVRKQVYPAKQFPNGHHELVESNIQLSQLYRILKQPSKAREHSDTGLNMAQKVFVAPEFPNGHPSLGLAYMASARVEDSERKFDAAIRLYAQAEAFFERFQDRAEFSRVTQQLAECRHALGVVLFRTRRFQEAAKPLEGAVELFRKLNPDDKGHPAIERASALAGEALLYSERAERAITLFQISVSHARKVFPKDRFPDGGPFLVETLSNLGTAYIQSKRHAESLPSLVEAFDLCKKRFPVGKFPHGHHVTAGVAQNIGVSLVELGQYEKATLYIDESVKQFRAMVAERPVGEREIMLAGVLCNAGFQRESLGRFDEAARYYEESLALYRKLALPGSNELPLAATPLLGNLPTFLSKRGEHVRARELGYQALAMVRRQYPKSKFPDGHPKIISAITSLVEVHVSAGQWEAAEQLSVEAMQACRKLYSGPAFPRGHPSLANTINNHAIILYAAGDEAQALQFAREAIDMYRKVYPVHEFPKGERSFAKCLSMLALQLMSAKRPEEALAVTAESLDMVERLFPVGEYPNGNPAILNALQVHSRALIENGRATDALVPIRRAVELHDRIAKSDPVHEMSLDRLMTISVLGEALLRTGQFDEAAATLDRARVAYLKRLELFAATGVESEIWQMSMVRPPFFQDFMSATRSISGGDERAYAAVWPMKAAVSRMLQIRHESARIARSKSESARKTWRELQDVRQAIASLALDPSPDRVRRLEERQQRRDELEREMIQQLPALAEHRGAERLAPSDLSRLLPDSAAFLDFVQYVQHGKSVGEFHEHYAVFIHLPNQPIRRIEIGTSVPIDAAALAWRREIESRKPETSAGRLAELLWKPIKPFLPASIHTLYVSPDADLARIPWCALPGREPGTVLLEEFSGGIAVMPHGPFLAQALKGPTKPSDSKGRVALIGGVDFGAGSLPYPELPATRHELKQIRQAAGDRATHVFEGVEATTTKVTAELSNVEYAHFATHGFFAEDELTADLNRRRRLARSPESVPSGTCHVGAKSPLAYTGLALAGANLRDSLDRGIMTGETIVGLPLDHLRLCVLSACETGLGAHSNGEGVFGLTRAFHLAGCPNVVASLWKVNDAATAALMAKFYHELWVNKKPPIEALREAQLFVYYNPDKIPDVLGERGAPKRSEALAVKSGEPRSSATGAGKRAGTKLWAAFVLSGVGK